MVGLEPQFSVFLKVAVLHSFYSISLCPFWLCDHLAEDKGTGCFIITVSVRLCVCPRLYSTALAGHTRSSCADPEGATGGPDSLEKSQIYRVSWSGYSENHKATKPEFNVEFPMCFQMS